MTVGEDSDDVPVVVVLIGDSLCRIGGEAAAAAPTSAISPSHCHSVTDRFPCMSISISKSPITPFIKASSPVVDVAVDGGVLQNVAPRTIIFPLGARFPNVLLVQLAKSPPSVLNIPCPSPRNVPSALSVLVVVPMFIAFTTEPVPLLMLVLAMKLVSNWGWGATVSTLCPVILPCSTKSGSPSDAVVAE